MQKPTQKEAAQELLTNLINFLLSFSIMLSNLFIPLLGADQGASSFEIGLLVGAYGVAFLLSSLYFGRKSDTLGRLGFVRYGLLAASLAFLSQVFAQNLILLIISRSLVGLALGVVASALLAYVYESVGHMGKFSSYGSLGWIFSSMVAGILKDYNLLFLVSFALSLIAFILTFRLKEISPGGRTASPSLLAVVHSHFQVYLAIFLRHLGAQAVWTIFPLYLVWLGANKFWVGFLWSINFGVQFIVMRYVDRFDAKKIFSFGQIVSIFVFLAYTLSADYKQLIAVQIALGLSWSCLYVGALMLVLGRGEEKGTASGIFQSTINMCSVIGPLIGGAIAQVYGYRGTMIFATVIGLAGLFTSLPESKKTSQQAL